MKLLIALALAAAPSALALAPYVPSEKNGCGEPCEGDVVTLDETSGVFDAIEDNKCYVVDGTFTGIIVPDGVSCAKITVPEGAKLQGIDAHLPRPSFDSTPNETLRRGARRSKATTRRSSSTARSATSGCASRVRCFLLSDGLNTTSRRSCPKLTKRRSRSPAPLPSVSPSISERAPCVPSPPKALDDASLACRSCRLRPRSR